MLQRPEVNCDNIMRLADHLADNVTDAQFDMQRYCSCIAGHSLRLFHANATGFGAFGGAAQDLGISTGQANALFCATHKPLSDIGRHEAVSVLRNLAVTGRVDWQA